MQNEETTNGVQVETQEDETEEVAEESQSEETTPPSTQITVEERVTKAEAEAAKYRRLFEKSQKPTEKKVIVQPDSINIDERVLKAQGMPNEQLTVLKDIARLRGTSLIDAQSDPLFEAEKSRLEKEEKAKKAQLGASRGAPKTQPKKDFTTPGLSREDHMALSREMNG